MYKQIHVDKLHEAVEESMKMLNEAPIVDGENQDRSDQLKEISVLIDVADVSEPTISYAMIGDLYELVKYELELVEGVRDFEPEWEYTYHRNFEPYWDACVAELKRNADTRRAVLPICGKTSYGNEHPPCAQVVIFKIIGNKLNTTVIFRSNDGCKAFAMNAFGFVRLAHKMAKEVGVEVGSYTHIANSFHCYSKDWDELNAYCERFKKTPCLFYDMDDYMEAYDEFAQEYRNQCLERKKKLGV